MNFYKRFIGDITAKTGGLSLARMGAYDRLLDHFYSTELPIAPEEVYSICRAMTRADRSDVDAVLARFWDLTPAGFVQGKAEEVIAKARPLIEAARANGKKGGRPKKQNPEETQPVSKNNPEETQGEPGAKATQSQSQIPSLRSGGRAAPVPRPEDVSEQVWEDWTQLRKSKRAPVSVTTLKDARAESEKAGLSLDRFLTIWCLRGSQGLQADWLRADERRPQATETVYQQSQRERVAEFAPGVAKRPGAIDVEATNVAVIAGH